MTKKQSRPEKPIRPENVDRLVAVAMDDIEKLQLILSVASQKNPDLLKGLAKSWGVKLSNDEADHVIAGYQNQLKKPINVAYT